MSDIWNDYLALLHSRILFRDWIIFYDAGQAVREGLSPYSVTGYFNPIQLSWLLSFTVWIPAPLWAILMCVLTTALVVVVAKKRAHWYLLSLPFIFSLVMGMMDMFLWVPARLLGGIGLSLLTLKPQLFVLYAPFQVFEWVREKNWKQIRLLFASTFLLWGIPTLKEPAWIENWLRVLPNPIDKMHGGSFAGYIVAWGSPGFYYALFVIIMIGLLILRERDLYPLATSFSPAFSLVDHAVNAEFATWRYTLLSWLLMPLGVGPQGAQQFFLLGVLIYFENRRQSVKASPVG